MSNDNFEADEYTDVEEALFLCDIDGVMDAFLEFGWEAADLRKMAGRAIELAEALEVIEASKVA
jgi:hypothetical protein